LLTLTAADLMSRDLVLIPQHMSLRTAGQLLSRSCISGAPVVDEAGRCVGVLSVNDFLQRAVKEGQPMALAPRTSCACSDWQIADTEQLPVEEGGAYMTADPVTVSPSTALVDLARMMLDAHIHRVIVVDGDRRPVGVVSSTDILAAVAHAGLPRAAGEQE
jgi:CBS domain-containing protein